MPKKKKSAATGRPHTGGDDGRQVGAGGGHSAPARELGGANELATPWYKRTWPQIAGLLAALSLIVGAVGNIDTVFGWAAAPFRPDPDDAAIRSLRVGVTYESFRAALGKDPALRAEVDGLDRSVFVLDSAYVTSFSDESGVVAFGVIAKNGGTVGPVRFLNQEILLGEETIAEVLDYPFTRKFAAACGAQHAYFFEATEATPGAMNSMNIAAGVTLTATTRSSYSPDLRLACSSGLASLDADLNFHHVDDLDAYLSEFRDLRATTVADSVYITRPMTEISHDMIWLHPDELSSVDPWQNE